LFIDSFSFAQQLMNLFFKTFLLLLHSPITHRFMTGGIGLDLRAVQRNMAQFDQTSLLAQL
jgi:hypothetical protein